MLAYDLYKVLGVSDLCSRAIKRGELTEGSDKLDSRLCDERFPLFICHFDKLWRFSLKSVAVDFIKLLYTSIHFT